MDTAAPITYTVSNGDIVLTLTEVEAGSYIATSPMDPELITESDSVGEAFELATDALAALRESRAKLVAQLKSIV